MKRNKISPDILKVDRAVKMHKFVYLINHFRIYYRRYYKKIPSMAINLKNGIIVIITFSQFYLNFK